MEREPYPMVYKIYLVVMTVLVALSGCDRPQKKDDRASEKAAADEKVLLAQPWCEAPIVGPPRDNQFGRGVFIIFRYWFYKNHSYKKEIGYLVRPATEFSFYDQSNTSKWATPGWLFKGIGYDHNAMILDVKKWERNPEGRGAYNYMGGFYEDPTHQIDVLDSDSKVVTNLFNCPSASATRPSKDDLFEKSIFEMVEASPFAMFGRTFLTPGAIQWPIEKIELTSERVRNTVWCEPIMEKHSEFHLFITRFDNGRQNIRHAFYLKSPGNILEQVVKGSSPSMDTASKNPTEQSDDDCNIYKSSDHTFFRVCGERHSINVPCSSYRAPDGNYIFGNFIWKPITAEDPFKPTEQKK
jgi:hypothetical protein